MAWGGWRAVGGSSFCFFEATPPPPQNKNSMRVIETQGFDDFWVCEGRLSKNKGPPKGASSRNESFWGCMLWCRGVAVIDWAVGY